MDVKTGFLNKNLQDDVYVTQLESFEYKKFIKKVFKLKKSIYRIKQVSKS
jgi:hypothetical protein